MKLLVCLLVSDHRKAGAFNLQVMKCFKKRWQKQLFPLTLVVIINNIADHRYMLGREAEAYN